MGSGLVPENAFALKVGVFNLTLALRTNDSRPLFLRQKEFTINAAKGLQFLINLPSLRHKKQQTTCALRDERKKRAGSHRAAINKVNRSSYSVVNSGLRLTITS